MLPPPPSHARVRQRWFVWSFDPVRITTTSLTGKSEMQVGLWPFSPICVTTTSLAGKSETEVGLWPFNPVCIATTSLAGKSEMVGLWPFNSVHIAPTSLTGKSKMEVGVNVVLTLFMLPPPPSHTVGKKTVRVLVIYEKINL
jgi:hypothetical protein